MTIKEVSEKYNISADTLRYYEKIGLIMPVTRKNGIRHYGETELNNVEFVLCMRGAGLPLEVLAKYINLAAEGDSTAEQRRQMLIDERENLKQKIADMQKALDKLNYKIDVYYTDILGKEKQMLKND